TFPLPPLWLPFGANGAQTVTLMDHAIMPLAVTMLDRLLGLALLVISTAGQAQQPANSSPVAAQWSDEQANSQPFIWMKNTYSYQPSAWMTGDNNAWKIWFCGGSASGTSGDSIFCTTANPTSKAAAEPTPILKPP